MKTIIADEQRMFQEMIHQMCANELELEVVGQAVSCAEAEQLIAAKTPELVIVDPAFAEGDGLAWLQRRCSVQARERYVVISAQCTEFAVLQIMNTAAMAFIDKRTEPLSTLHEAVRAVRRGERYYSETFLRVSLELLTNRHTLLRTLSPRELVVFQSIAWGASDAEIARDLSIAERTVQTHRHNILQKTGMPTTARLMVLANEKGLLLSRPRPLRPVERRASPKRRAKRLRSRGGA